jgi:hypothetical protein
MGYRCKCLGLVANAQRIPHQAVHLTIQAHFLSGGQATRLVLAFGAK